jgi:CubicO group peptidase (beta-lactamase class C family)
MRKGDRARRLRDRLEAEVSETAATGLFKSCFVECGLLSVSVPTLRHYYGCDSSSIFDLASLSKALVLAPLVYQTSLDFSLDLKATIGDWIPNVNIPQSCKALRVSDLLAHESGLPAWLNFWVDRIELESSIFELQKTGLEHIETVLGRSDLTGGNLGEDLYSDVGMILLSYTLQRLRGESLEKTFHRIIGSKVMLAEPAGFFGGPSLLDGVKGRAVPTAYCPLRDRVLKGEVHDENTFALGGFTGHAGLFATGPSLAKCLKKADIIGDFSSFLKENAKLLANSTRTGLLGLRRGDDSGSLPFGSGHSMGHLGFTGTAFWIQPTTGKYAILLTNRVCSGRVSSQIQPFRARVMDLLENTMKNPS